MEAKQVEHYDFFDEAIVFWIDINGVPQDIQNMARQIDKENYNPDCFGICVDYVFETNQFIVIIDTEHSVAQPDNCYYIDNDGEKHWFRVGLEQEFLEQAFLMCVEAVAGEPFGTVLTQKAALQSAAQAVNIL